MKLALNIGKCTSDRYGHPVYVIADTRIRSAVEAHGFKVQHYAVRESSTEPTATLVVQDVAVFGLVSLRTRLTLLAKGLHQECIAAVPLEAGEHRYDIAALVGPHADEWGAFNKDLFLELA